MAEELQQGERPTPPRPMNRMPEGSLFYERVVPALLVLLGIVTVVLILFAAGVLLGIVPFR